MAEGGLSDQLIIFIVILGSAAIIACGYGMHRALASRQTSGSFERAFNERNVEQDQYMVDLRMAYREGVIADAGSHRPRPGPGPGPGPRYSQESSEYGNGYMADSRKGQQGH